jgi:hypothetical protein
MQTAARIGIIIVVLIILATIWYGYQQLQNDPVIGEGDESMAKGCTPVSYDSQGFPTTWSCPKD